MGEFNCGQASSTSFSELGFGQGVVLTYTGGDVCPNNANRKSILSFHCDPSASTPVIQFTSENPMCTYNFNISTKEACPRSPAPQAEMCILNVFLVPHTHDDVGWLLTVQGYYETQVRNILDTTVAALQANPKRKFIYVEQAFFTLWWNDARTTDAQRNAVKQFVNEGRWEFIIGAWVMPDEACTTYGGIIDQMTLGHQFLLNTFGVRPTKGWQIDPFGASSVTPVLEKLAGFDAHLIDRITDKDTYQNSQRLEFMWQGVPALGTKGQIFTEIMGGGGYCDWLGQFNFENDPVNPSNVAKYGQQFVNMAQGRSNWYKTPNILAEWGCDFAFQNAAPMFHSMDQVVDWLQSNALTTHVNVSYATPSQYYDSVWQYAEKQNIAWPNTDQQDYFPYLASLWWTGYYTSRVELKGFVREGEATSHIAEPLFSVGNSIYHLDSKSTFDAINQLRVANGYAQHHDGVTGTSVPEVVEMYKNYLIDGINVALKSAAVVLNQWIMKGPTVGSLVPGGDALLSIANGQTVAVVLFNGLGWSRSDVVVFPVNRSDLVVVDSNLKPVSYQISPATGGNITSSYQLFFPAFLNGLGYQTYFVSAPSQEIHQPPQFQPLVEDTTIENSVLSITYSQSTNRISHMTNKKTGVSISVDQNLLQYRSIRSGAYAFGPDGPATPISNSPQTAIIKGNLVTEIVTQFPASSDSNYAKQTVRLYSNQGNPDIEEFAEIWFDIGPLPSHIEVVTAFNTSIDSQNLLTSEDNGFQFMKRTYNWGTGIESNYYPIIYASFIDDPFAQLSVVAERSHGVSSQANGEIEVMIHRNPDMGDGFGPGLTDTTRVYPGLRVLLDKPEFAFAGVRRQSYLYNFPLSAFTSVTTTSDWLKSFNTAGSLLQGDLPANIHLLSLNALDATSKNVILRLAHIFDLDEDPVLSMPVTLDLSKIFSQPIAQITETTLTANQNLSTATIITINPKDIRTFLIQFK